MAMFAGYIIHGGRFVNDNIRLDLLLSHNLSKEIGNYPEVPDRLIILLPNNKPINNNIFYNV